MSPRFKNSQQDPAPVDDGQTVAALVAMLSGMGIERSRIDAMISKTARPNADAKPAYKAEVANDGKPDRTSARRSA